MKNKRIPEILIALVVAIAIFKVLFPGKKDVVSPKTTVSATDTRYATVQDAYNKSCEFIKNQMGVDSAQFRMCPTECSEYAIDEWKIVGTIKTETNEVERYWTVHIKYDGHDWRFTQPVAMN